MKVLGDCDTGTAGGKDSPDYWEIVRGDCYTVGDALGWLYQCTARKDLLYANILMRRFNRQNFEQAVAAGAPVNEDYWTLIKDKVYALTPIGTPIAVTPIPPDATPVAANWRRRTTSLAESGPFGPRGKARRDRPCGRPRQLGEAGASRWNRQPCSTRNSRWASVSATGGRYWRRRTCRRARRWTPSRGGC
jgi:hypothetical protein